MTHEGIVVLYHPKGWGFIRENSGEQWFFHKDNAASKFEPYLGAEVAFEVAPPIRLGQKDQAVGVRPVGSAQ